MERVGNIMEYFYYEESPINKENYFIRFNYEKLNLKSTIGSFNIICARIMGLTYADYLRMCRDVYGAEINGKNTKYPIAVFKKSELENLKILLKILNKRTKTIIERN